MDSVEKGLSMEGGTGDGSYARNSDTQAAAIGEVTHRLGGALRRLVFRDERVIRIADLGCSTGPNTLAVINLAVNCLQEQHPLDRVEYQAFFSDLASNDFNTLFRMLPPPGDAAASGGSAAAAATRAYYAAGVPGSFFKRQFPRASLHVVMSFLSLHWLSKVPDAVHDPNSPSSNKGFVSIDHAPLAAVAAFSQQADEDLRAFLSNRAEEMVPNGLLFLLFLGREDHSHPEIQWPSNPPDASDPHYLFASEFLNTWNDLLSAGLITAETRDSFNLPTFHRSLEEVQEAVKASQGFEIQMLEQKPGSWFSAADRAKWANDHKSFGRMWNNIAKSTLGSLVEAHIGHHLTHIFFQQNEANIIKAAASILSPRHYYVLNVVCLLRR